MSNIMKESFFSIPIFYVDIENSQELNNKLTHDILQWKKEDEKGEDVFVKPKKSTIKNNNNNKRIVSNVVSNKYIYKGNVNDLTIFKQKIEKDDGKKKKLSFADYKKLLLTSTC